MRSLALGLDVQPDVQFILDNKQGSRVQVAVTHNFTPAMGLFTTAAIPLRSSSRMVFAR